MPSLHDVAQYVPLGVALGAVYGVSGVGIVVLYRATGVLNLAYGAIGALGAFLSWELINDTSWSPDWLAYMICIAFGGAATLLYGLVFGPVFAARDPLVKATGTLGLALIFLAVMSWVWPASQAKSLALPSSGWHNFGYQVGDVRVNWTQIMALAFAVSVTAGTAAFLRLTKLGTAMRALADDREITATLGVPVRRVEAAAWLGSGLVCGAAGLLLPSLLLSLDAVTLTFLVISALAGALIGRLQSLWVTLLAALVIGIVEACLAPFTSWPTQHQPLSQYRTMTPFVFAIVALLWLGRRRLVTVRRAGQ